MISRRTLLKHLGALGALSALGFPNLSFANVSSDSRLIIVILRGGLDGLAAVPAYGDRSYKAARGSLHLPDPGSREGILDLNGFFGLHPSLKPLHELYLKQELSVYHAVATPYRERSHFDGQDILETGASRVYAGDNGWLNRTVGLLGGNSREKGLAIGHSLPLLMRGENSISSWAPSVLPDLSSNYIYALEQIYRDDPLLANAMEAGLGADELAKNTLGKSAKGKLRQLRPNRASRASAEVVGKFLRAADGPRVASFDIGGWDTHANQGTSQGQLANKLKNFAESIVTLKTSLGPVWKDTSVLIMTEFGRTVAANGTGGTDHGTAGVCFLAGGAIKGGEVRSKWPGLAKSKLYEGRDLAPTTDIRTLAAGLIHEQFNLPKQSISKHVFPGLQSSSFAGELLRKT